MSQFTSYDLPDIAATDITFVPVSNLNGVAKWHTDNVAYAEVVDKPVVTLSMRPGRVGNPTNYAARVKRKVVCKLSVPFTTAFTTDSNNPLHDTIDVEIRVSVPVDAGSDNINNSVAFLTGLLSEDQITDAIALGEFVY